MASSGKHLEAFFLSLGKSSFRFCFFFFKINDLNGYENYVFYIKSSQVGESIWTNNFNQQLPATLQTPDEQLILCMPSISLWCHWAAVRAIWTWTAHSRLYNYPLAPSQGHFRVSIIWKCVYSTLNWLPTFIPSTMLAYGMALHDKQDVWLNHY